MTTEGRTAKWVPLAIVLATGMAMGFFVWSTYFAYGARLHAPAFEDSQWMVAADGGPQGYFRSELYIPGTVAQAWITVAATDSFVLYVNESAVDAQSYASLNVSGIYDVGRHLRPGKNVLAVVVRRRNYPGPAMAVVQGAYVDGAGHEHTFAGDSSWKFAATGERQGGGSLPWYSELFDASSWVAPRTAGRPGRGEVYPLSVNPLAFTMRPQGKWIGRSGPGDGPAAFSYSVMLSGRPSEAWIRLVAAPPYKLMVNGWPVGGEDQRGSAVGARLLRYEGAARWRGDARESTHIYDIAALLRGGPNQIVISPGPTTSGEARLMADGFVISRGEILPFGTDASWRVLTPAGSEDGRGPGWASALVLGDRELASGSLPVKRVIAPVLPLGYAAKQIMVLGVVLLLVTALVVGLWRGTGRMLQALGVDAEESRRRDALVHLPALLLLSGLFMLSFDVRFDPTFPFRAQFVWLAVAVLVVLKAALMCEAWYRKGKAEDAGPATLGAIPITRHLYVVSLVCLMLAGAALRLYDLDGQSLYHDEVRMVTYVQGLFEKGYPYKMIGPMERPLATYELLPYPIALSARLLGFTDFALRLPAALFGILTIPLIYLVARRVFDQRVGLLAATIYAFCPQSLIWAKYLWHPQETQFFALLTSYVFYRAIASTPMSPRYLYLAALSFGATYLSWEGAGFLLPALALGLVAVKGKDFSWLRDKHLWLAVGIAAVVVGVQLARRVLLQVPYIVVGTGLGDISTPSLFFLDPMYAPTFYVQNFLWLENNAVLTVLLLAGVAFLFRDRGFLYYASLLLSVVVMMTNLLAHPAVRYAYYLQPFLILAAAVVAVRVADYALGVIERRRGGTVRLVGVLARAGVCVLVVAGSTIVTKLDRITDFANPSGIHTREDVYYIDYRTPAQFLKARYQEGDLVISVVPEALEHYAKIESQYFMETYTMRQLYYDPSGVSPMYLEQGMGRPTVNELGELKNVLNRYRRTWIVAVPYGGFLDYARPEVADYVERRGKVVYESYNARIYLLES